ncbi:unnamed protein product [Linum trigynum]|uniref:Uncharacterized protein n=1 Tax=Linum trigynum TaxID=586398 RepID=A0AAV2ETU0_9ROSI
MEGIMDLLQLIPLVSIASILCERATVVGNQLWARKRWREVWGPWENGTRHHVSRSGEGAVAEGRDILKRGGRGREEVDWAVVSTDGVWWTGGGLNRWRLLRFAAECRELGRKGMKIEDNARHKGRKVYRVGILESVS